MINLNDDSDDDRLQWQDGELTRSWVNKHSKRYRPSRRRHHHVEFDDSDSYTDDDEFDDYSTRSRAQRYRRQASLSPARSWCCCGLCFLPLVVLVAVLIGVGADFNTLQDLGSSGITNSTVVVDAALDMMSRAEHHVAVLRAALMAVPNSTSLHAHHSATSASSTSASHTRTRAVQPHASGDIELHSSQMESSMGRHHAWTMPRSPATAIAGGSKGTHTPRPFLPPPPPLDTSSFAWSDMTDASDHGPRRTHPHTMSHPSTPGPASEKAGPPPPQREAVGDAVVGAGAAEGEADYDHRRDHRVLPPLPPLPPPIATLLMPAQGQPPHASSQALPGASSPTPAPDASTAPGGPTSGSATPRGTAPACTSAMPNDVSTPQCQHFCRSHSAKTHCSWCKCKRCSFCATQPGEPGRGGAAAVLPGPALSATEAFAPQIGAPVMKPRGLPAIRGPATPSAHRTPASPSGTTPSAHRTPASASTGMPSVAIDGPPSPRPTASTSSVPRGGGASASACVSSHDNDVHTAQCQSFCQSKAARGHCSWCKCKRCSFCTSSSARLASNGVA